MILTLGRKKTVISFAISEKLVLLHRFLMIHYYKKKNQSKKF